MSDLELRHLRHFVAVAEHLHFGRAATALHVSQPSLSRSVKDLERVVGATLLARTRRRVELTPEGEWFLGEATRLVTQLDRAVAGVGLMAGGTRGILRVGFVPLADYGVLPPLLSDFKARRPGVSLALREMLSPDQVVALEAGDLDLGLLVPPVPDGFEHVVVQRDPFLAALPERHELARTRGPIAVRDLGGEAFIMVPRVHAPALHDLVVDLASRAGFVPRVAQEAIEMQTVVSLVSSGLGVALVPASVSNLGRRGVVYRKIAGPNPCLELWLAWRRDRLTASAREFVGLATQTSRNDGVSAPGGTG